MVDDHVPDMLLAFLTEHTPGFVVGSHFSHTPFLKTFLLGGTLPDQDTLATSRLLDHLYVFAFVGLVIHSRVGPIDSPEHEFFESAYSRGSSLHHD